MLIQIRNTLSEQTMHEEGMEKLFEETSIVQLVKFLSGHIVSEMNRKVEPGLEANDFYYFGLELMLILNMMAFISDEIITEILF